MLKQIDRRLELIESDVRAVSEKLDASVQTLNEKWDTSVQGLNEKWDTSVQKLHDKIDTYFRWAIGIILASWLSTMCAILFKGAL